MDALFQKPPRALGVQVPRGGRVRHEHRPPALQAPRLGRAGGEADRFARRCRRLVGERAARGRTAQGGDRPGELLAAQDLLGQFHGDKVGEAPGRRLGRLLRGALHAQGGADAHPGVVEEFQALACHLARPVSARSSVVSLSVTTLPA
ncbi:hypothetical protein GCM10009564_48620 [Streptomyces thermogriseus]|uniref:Uncharacterized protein n=1 Tax=Streptomyces thermogriseus TaxID=75292 RepID=A0ABP4DNA7_9ACTN